MTAGRAFAGHPVDVASGVQFTAAHDAEIDGLVELTFRRSYSTALLTAAHSVLGPGWVHGFEATLVRDLAGFEFNGHDGQRISFDDVRGTFEASGSLLNAGECMELRREGDRLVVYHWHHWDDPVQKYVFLPAEGDRMRLQARELPSGHGLVVQYDGRGRVGTVTQSAERRRLSFTYDDDGLLAELHVSVIQTSRPPMTQLVARYAYDALKRLILVYDPLGAAQEYGYDDAGRLILERGRNGGTYRMKYDAAGRCIETSGDGGYERRRFFYNPEARVTRVLDSADNETLYQYNEKGQIQRKVLANGAVFSTDYDDLGRIVAEIGPIGDTTKYQYDADGNTAKTTHPNGAVQQIEYDTFHQPCALIDPDGGRWTLRCERGALVEVVDPVRRTTRYVRNGKNDLVEVVTPTGNRVTLWEDLMADSASDFYGPIYGRKYDLLHNPIEVSDANGVSHRYIYDALGRLIEDVRADGTRHRFEYDAESNLVRAVDGRGGVHVARYSPHGDCVAQVDPLGRTHELRWDNEGQLVEIRNPRGETTKLFYDSVGNLVRIEHFDGSVESAEFDLAGRQVRTHLPDGTVLDTEYDVVDNPTAVRCRDVELRHLTYDLSGEILAARTPDSAITYEYEIGGRIRAEVQNGRRIEYAYHATGGPSRRTFQGSKIGPLSFQYDGRGRLVRFGAEGAGEQTMEYDARDYPTRRGIGSLTEQLECDYEGRIKVQRIGTVQRTYEYDGEGGLVHVTDAFRGPRSYQYDPAEQLLRTMGTSEEHHYRYDENGNLVVRDHELLRYGPGDRLLSIGGVTLARDAVGRVTSVVRPEGESRYDWDCLGQLIRVVHPDGAVTRFGYDALGRRVFKDHASRRTNYYWSGHDLIAEERDLHSIEYMIVEAWPYAAWEDGRIRHIVTSNIGAPREIFDENAGTVWTGEFDDWGRLLGETGSTTCPLRLPGQYADPETGLHYNRFRYYLPEAGQFISPDPVALYAGPNRFRYAPNAVNWIDPLGLYCGRHVSKKSKRYKGIKKTKNGGPDFRGTPYMFPTRGKQKSVVSIVMKGSRSADFKEANRLAGFPGSKPPKGYTWHHIDNFNPSSGRCTMQLVKTGAHEATVPHRGSVSQYDGFHGVDYG